MKKRKALISLLAIYLLSYIAIRVLSVENWEKDGKDYLIFPKTQIWVYYLYRPLTYVDGWLTGMQFHIGPHQ